MQRLRGSIYLRDGAIRPSDLTGDGRHRLAVDDKSWHLLLLDDEGSIAGCARYLAYPDSVSFEELPIAKSALAGSGEWGHAFRCAVEAELALARHSRFSYVEMGGWAMADRVRGTSECLRSILASYALVRLMGGGVAICPATERNGSAAILSRMGGRLLEWGGVSIPPYFDPAYGCRMQMLRFDPRASIERYEDSVQRFMAILAEAPVICADVPERRAPKTQFGTIPAIYPNRAGAFAAAV